MVGESGLRKALNYFCVILALIVFVFPIYWLVNQSFKGAAEFTAMPPTLIVNDPTGENYHSLWVEQEFWRYGINSLIIAIVAAVTAVTVGKSAAYALARFRLPGTSTTTSCSRCSPCECSHRSLRSSRFLLGTADST